MNSISKNTTEIIKHLEEQFIKAGTRNSPDKISRLLAEDFVEFGSSGTVYSKKMVIEALKTDLNPDINIRDFKITHLGSDAILATYIAVKNLKKDQKY